MLEILQFLAKKAGTRVSLKPFHLFRNIYENYFPCAHTTIELHSNQFLSADRLKDLTSLAGVRSNQLVGYGVVVGLAGTGDGNTGITLQSMQSLFQIWGDF